MIVGNQRNFAAGLLYIAIGITVIIGASSYEIGTAARMGPGYFPVGLGIFLSLIGSIVLLSSFGKRTLTLIGAWPLRSIFIVLSSVVVFAFTLERFGLVVALPLLVGISSLAHPQCSWRAVVGSVIVLVPLAWLIFIYFLGLPFPMFPNFSLQ